MKFNLSVIRSSIDAAKIFLKETRAEAKKVVWPNRQYVVAATIIILAIVFATGFFILFIDYLFGKFFGVLIK